MRRELKRGPQSVKKRIWYLGGKQGRKRQKGGAFPFGLIASTVTPLVGEVVKPIFKKIFVGLEEEKDNEGNNNFTKKCYTDTNFII